MQYLIALAVALLSGRSYLAVAPKLWCVCNHEGFAVSRLCGRTAVIAGLSGALQVGQTKSVFWLPACSKVARRLAVIVTLNVER